MLRLALILAALAGAGAAHAQALDGRLKRIAETKTINIAYRADAMPFSFDDKGTIDGFSIELCKRVVRSMERQLKVQGLKINWVRVTSGTRFQAVAKGQADMECGSSSITLERMRQVDFSSIIFIETTGLLVKGASGARSMADLSGKVIAVVAGTTNERAINAHLKLRQMNATVAPFKTRDEAFAALEAGKVDAFASDKLLLLGASTNSKDPKALLLLTDELSYEPYGIVLPRGDSSLRLAVNTGLSRIYGSGEIVEVYRQWFAAFGRPAPILEAAYTIGVIHE